MKDIAEEVSGVQVAHHRGELWKVLAETTSAKSRWLLRGSASPYQLVFEVTSRVWLWWGAAGYREWSKTTRSCQAQSYFSRGALCGWPWVDFCGSTLQTRCGRRRTRRRSGPEVAPGGPLAAHLQSFAGPEPARHRRYRLQRRAATTSHIRTRAAQVAGNRRDRTDNGGASAVDQRAPRSINSRAVDGCGRYYEITNDWMPETGEARLRVIPEAAAQEDRPRIIHDER